MTYDEKSTHLREDATAGKPSFKILDTESGAKAHALQDAGATQLRADGESESVSRNETCASRIAIPDAGARVGQLRSGGLGGKSGGFRSKSRRKYRVIPHNPA